LDMVHRSMALLTSTSLAAEGRGTEAMAEHAKVVQAIADNQGDAASDAIKKHLSSAFETRLKIDAGELKSS